MAGDDHLNRESWGGPRRFSYVFIAGTLLLVGALHLATPLLTTLLAYLALSHLRFGKRTRKWMSIVLFLVFLLGVAYGTGSFVRRTVKALPDIADRAIPSIIQWAKRYEIELPFSDFDSLKDVAIDAIKGQADYLSRAAKFARGAGSQFVFVIIGCVVAIGLFIDPRFQLEHGPPLKDNNLYSVCCNKVAERFTLFYKSFAIVMGGQILISAINTVFTAIFVLVVQLPHPVTVIGLTFFCGLVPVIGNLVSNSVIVGIAFTVTPQLALISLVFLVVIHKLEYFLNGKIIGHRIRNPVWLTLLGLVLGEKLMGVPGMILAPVVLHYLKVEASRITV